MQIEKIKKIIGNLGKARVLVVGDLILDEYIWGSVDRISPEAPVPIVWAKKRTNVPGGAANVANNIRSLGGNVALVGAVGKDRNAGLLLTGLKERGIATAGICIEPARHTTVKTRIIAGHQQIVRVDWEHTDALSKRSNECIIRFIRANIKKFDAVIIEDYGKGVINRALLAELIDLVHAHKKIVTVDPKEENFQYYRGVTSITPNRKELESAIRNLKIKDTTNKFRMNSDKLATLDDVAIGARQVLEYLDLDSILVTLGEHGMQLFEEGGASTHIPTVAQEVFDVSGAGDTVISTFTASLSCGATKLEAAHIANCAAGIVVGKVGTAVTTRQELIEKVKSIKKG